MLAGGTIRTYFGRDPRHRTKMAVLEVEVERPGRGEKEAITHYRILQRWKKFSYLAVKLETGRTHQIRVHMAHLGYPIVGDITYGGHPRSEALKSFKRQALHAYQLTLEHPVSHETMTWTAPVPEDMQHLLDALV
jgi:23S rRNA pseudouridine1911/1915/1917 synthase